MRRFVVYVFLCNSLSAVAKNRYSCTVGHLSLRVDGANEFVISVTAQRRELSSVDLRQTAGSR
jgi:hypothetical protein